MSTGLKVKSLKVCIAGSQRHPVSQLWDITCHMGSHRVTCHPTQVNAPALTSANKPALDLPTPEGWKAELN